MADKQNKNCYRDSTMCLSHDTKPKKAVIRNRSAVTQLVSTSSSHPISNLQSQSVRSRRVSRKEICEQIWKTVSEGREKEEGISAQDLSEKSLAIKIIVIIVLSPAKIFTRAATKALYLWQPPVPMLFFHSRVCCFLLSSGKSIIIARGFFIFSIGMTIGIDEGTTKAT